MQTMIYVHHDEWFIVWCIEWFRFAVYTWHSIIKQTATWFFQVTDKSPSPVQPGISNLHLFR